MWGVVCKVIGREMLLCCPVQRDKRDANSISHSACGIETNSRIWFVLVLAVKPRLPTNHTCRSILECKYSGDSTKCTGMERCVHWRLMGTRVGSDLYSLPIYNDRKLQRTLLTFCSMN